jgi:PsbP
LSTQPPSHGNPPSHGQQSPYGQSPYGQSPYGPPPPQGRSNTTLIAVVVIVVLALAGGVVGAALMLGGDDSESSGGQTSETSQTSCGETIEGSGYTFAIPEGWDDATSDVQRTTGIDSAVRAEDEDDGFSRNVVIEVQPAAGATDPEQIRAQWQTNIGNAVDATPEPIDGTTIDGEDAVGVRVETSQQDVDVVQVAYLTIKNGRVYSIALSAHHDVEDSATAEFEQLLGSWSWT